MRRLQRVVEAGTDQADPVFRAARKVADAAALWHRVELTGREHLPDGPALLVGNHGLLGLDTFLFFHAVFRATGRVPVGLADRVVFGAPPIRSLLRRLGGVPGTRENALKLLQAGRWVVCYPGGSREVFKGPEAHNRLSWEKADGFARVAIAAGVPVIPFAGLGVDELFVNLGHVRLLKMLLGRYTPPITVGLGLLPLPVQVRFVLDSPLMPPKDLRNVPAFKAEVKARVERLMEGHAPVTQGAAAAVS